MCSPQGNSLRPAWSSKYQAPRNPTILALTSLATRDRVTSITDVGAGLTILRIRLTSPPPSPLLLLAPTHDMQMLYSARTVVRTFPSTWPVCTSTMHSQSSHVINLAVPDESPGVWEAKRQSFASAKLRYSAPKSLSSTHRCLPQLR